MSSGQDPVVGHEAQWSLLYRTAGWAALLSAALIPVQLVVFMVWGQPGSALGWFELFRDNPVGGLLAFEFLFIFSAVAGTALVLAFYVALRERAPSAMSLALVLGVVEAVALILARPALEMLQLSQEYFAASSESERTAFLGAGEAVRAALNGTAFHVSYNLFSVYYLLISLVMLRSRTFGRALPALGIAAALLNWGLYVPGIGLFLSVLSVIPCLLVWYVLAAVRFFRRARTPDAVAVRRMPAAS
ncbi:DUF4386 family protein [Sinomonas flava]|uniref:DUF4386 family protein n=1 Tax=Sinomonas flava TaxID=496857 RepID=UPI0039A6788C